MENNLNGDEALLAELNSTYGSAESNTAGQGAQDHERLLASLEKDYGKADESPVRGTLAEMGRQAAAGTVVDIPEMAGKAIQRVATEDSGPYQFGKEMRENAEERGKEWKPDLRDKGEVSKAFIGAFRAIPASLAPIAATVAAGPIGGIAATGALYGLSSAQDTYEKVKAAGKSDEEARNAGILTGLAQAGGEYAQSVLGGRVLGALGKGASKTIGELTGKVAAGGAEREVLKPWAKATGQAMLGEPATEIGQDVATEAIERAYGAKPSAEYGDIAYQSGTTAAAMAALLSPLGLAGHTHNAKMAEHFDNALIDYEMPAAQRASVVNRLANRAKAEGIPDADVWREGAMQDIENKLPIRRSTDQPPVAPEAIGPAPGVATNQPEVATNQPEVATNQPEVATNQPEVATSGAEVTTQEETATTDWDKLSAYADNIKKRRSIFEQSGREYAPPVSPSLVEAAKTAGVYQEGMGGLDLQNAIIAKVEEQKTPGQKVAENIAGKGTISDILASNAYVIDEDIQRNKVESQTDMAATEEAPAGVAQREAQPVENDPFSPDNLDTQSETTLRTWLNTAQGNSSLKAQEQAIREALVRKKTKQREEAENAQPINSPSPLDGGSVTQSEIREEGGNLAVDSAGVPPSGPEIGNLQPESQQAPLSQEGEVNGESTNQTPQAAPQEVSEVEASVDHPTHGVVARYAPAKSLTEAAKITEASKRGLSEEQIQKGEYQRGFTDIDGLSIAIENPKGTFRTGVDKSTGKRWEQEMHSHYGEIGIRDENGELITGADGDLPDVFIAPNIRKIKKVWVIDQKDREGKFDEHKVVIGPLTEKGARQAYIDNYETGWTGLGAITPMSLDEFKQWLRTEDTSKPVSENFGVVKEKKQPSFTKTPSQRDDLTELIRKLGGLNREEAVAQDIDEEYFKPPADKKSPLRFRPVFPKKGGLSFEHMAELLKNEYGYDNFLTGNDLLASLSDALNQGKKIASPVGQEAIAEQEYAKWEADQRDEGEWLRTEFPAKVDRLLELARQAGKEAVIQEELDAGDITPYDIGEHIADFETFLAKEKREAEEPVLQPYSEADVTAKDERESEVSKKEAENAKAAEAKRKADSEVDDVADLFTRPYGDVNEDIFDIPFSRPDRPTLEAIFDGISLPETQRAIQNHPLREKIEYIEANAFDLMNELLQSEKNPNGKVRRIC